MRATIHRIGNSRGVIIPRSLLAQLDFADEVEMTVEHGTIVLAKPRAGLRAGWAEDSKAIAAAGDDALLWPEFGNADDGDLAW